MVVLNLCILSFFFLIDFFFLLEDYQFYYPFKQNYQLTLLILFFMYVSYFTDFC